MSTRMSRTARDRARRPRSPRSSSSSTSTAPGAPTSPPASGSTTTCSTAFARHALVDLTVQTDGDTHIDAHHTVEDTAIVLGQALREALGDKAGIRRFGDATVPLDEALVQAVVDVSGRPYCVHTGEPEGQAYVVIGGDRPYLGSLTRHVFESLASTPRSRCTSGCWRGRDPHHLVEAQFKAVARALRDAVALDPRETGVPSTKGTLVTLLEPLARSSSSTTARATSAPPSARSSAPAPTSRSPPTSTAALDADGLVVPGVGRVRRLHGRPARGPRRPDDRPPARRRPAGARHLRRHAGPVRARRRARRRDRGLRRVARASSSGCRRPSCRTWAGTPSRSPPGTALFAGVEDERFYFVHSYGVRDWTLVTNDRTRARRW